VALVAGAAALGLACCGALASMAASAEGGNDDEPATVSKQPARRLAQPAPAQPPNTVAALCRAAQQGEPCHGRVLWAMETGIKEHEDWYPGLTANSRFEDFQAFLSKDPVAACPRPCTDTEQQLSLVAKAQAKDASTVHGMDMDVLGYPADSRVVAQGQWCTANEPQQGWSINGCGQGHNLQVKLLTYNLFWWNLFGQRNGNGGSAGQLISSAHARQPFDFMGFQECEDIHRVLGDAGLDGEFEAMPGPHAMCMAYRKSTWQKIADDSQNVGEDRWDQWYGQRAAMWVRLQHLQTGQVVFFINHHGPLPVDTGGMCGGEATAFNLLKLIANNAHSGDVAILVGDFNAGPQAQTLQSLGSRLHNVYTGNSFGGVDNVLSSCPNMVATQNLGSGGSDHDALEAVIQL